MTARRRSWLAGPFFSLLLGCGAPRPTSPPNPITGASPAVHYSISLDADLRALHALACPHDLRLDRLFATASDAMDRIRKPRLVTAQGEIPLEVAGDALPIPPEMAGACIAYDVDLGPPFEGFALASVGDDLVASPDAWLWSPQPRPAGTTITASFSLPPGIHAALPWPRHPKGYEIPATTFKFEAAGAFGHFEPRPISLGASTLDVAPLGQGFGEREPLITDWLLKSADAVSSFYGGFPVDRALVLLLPEPGSGVGFGMAVHGGGPTVLVWVGESVKAEELAGDWTAVHEMFHLSTPRMARADAWLSEGLATYYTEILRGRAGLQDERETWENLADGFRRGERAGTGRTLRKESADMHETHAYKRVYWAGAALAFLTDVTLRRAGIERGLDGPMTELAHCCATSAEVWSAERLAAFVDAKTGRSVMRDMFTRYLDGSSFPATGEILTSLGVVPTDTRRFALVGDAPLAGLRRVMAAAREKK